MIARARLALGLPTAPTGWPLGCGANAAHLSPFGCCCSASTPPRSASTPSALPTTPADEPHYLLAAESLVDDRDVDVRDEYAARAYDDFYPYDLDSDGQETDGRLNEPHGLGFPLLIVPAYLLGGATGVELFLAAIAALSIALAYRLALYVVPDPWALAAAAVAGLSPPFLAYGTAVYPELTAGAALAGAALLAIGIDTRPGLASRLRLLCAAGDAALARHRSSCRPAS